MTMRYFKLLAVLVWLFVNTAVCQHEQKPTIPQTSAANDWVSGYRSETVAFGQVGHDNLTNRSFFSAIGTGVLISSGPQFAYLVTAKHVFCEPEKHWFPNSLNIRFAWQDHKSIYAYTGVPLALRNEKGAPLWFAPDDDSDVAAIPIGSPEALNKMLPPDDQRTGNIQVVSLDSLEKEDIYEGEQVLIFGYPGVAGRDKLARPILRQGIVAWTNPRNPAENVFLVDANLFPGNSGGPVTRFPFGVMKNGTVDYTHGGKLNLLGIVSEGGAQDIKGSVSGPNIGRIEMQARVVGIGSVGVIEPASKISKLLSKIQEGKTEIPSCDVHGD